jgi:hypothetical protein
MTTRIQPYKLVFAVAVVACAIASIWALPRSGLASGPRAAPEGRRSDAGPIPPELLAEFGFSPQKFVYGGTQFGEVRMPDDTRKYVPFVDCLFSAENESVHLTLHGNIKSSPGLLYKPPERRGPLEELGALENAWFENRQNALPSGLPFAKEVLVLREDRLEEPRYPLIRIHFRGMYESGMIALLSRPVPLPRLQFEYRPWDPGQYTGFIEAALRRTYARVASHRMPPVEPTDVSGRRVGTFQCMRTSQRLFDLEEWAAARGWAVGKPDSVPAVTLTKEGREVLLPLAAMQARVDGEWRELGDCVAEKDGRWLVPATLDDLVR